MKRLIVILLVLALAFSLAGCGHKHEWKEATCTEPKTCATCGETEGEPLGHTWVEATCTEPKTCSVCGETEGEPLGHTWVDATETEPKTCSVCGLTEGEPLGPDEEALRAAEEAARAAEEEAARLAEEEAAKAAEEEAARAAEEEAAKAAEEEALLAKVAEEEALLAIEAKAAEEEAAHEHSWMEATCTEPKTCSICGETEGEALGHSWIEATCTEPKTCSVCGETEGEALGHDWGEPVYTWADDLSAVTATRVCRNDESHAETEIAQTTAEVTTPETCEADGLTAYTAVFGNPAFETQTETREEPAAIGHDWGEPVYTWADDLSSVTAARVCRNDESHVETETAPATAAVTRESACEEPGETTYTAVFTDPAFAVQTATADDLEPLGHTWIEATHTEPRTCSVCGETEGESIPVDYFGIDFPAFREAFNIAYPGFLKISPDGESLCLKIKGTTLRIFSMFVQETGQMPQISFTYGDEYGVLTDRSDEAPIESFNTIRISFTSPVSGFDKLTAQNIAYIGCKLGQILDPTLTDKAFASALGDAAAAEGQTLSFIREGIAYEFASAVNNSVYEYTFTIDLASNQD